MKVDILYLAKDRDIYTAESGKALLANTNWDLVEHLFLYDDGSKVFARDLLVSIGVAAPLKNQLAQIYDTKLGSPVAIMNDFISRHHSNNVFVKIDNDTMMPPGWLEAVVEVFKYQPELSILGLEPHQSRTPAPWANGRRAPAPEIVSPKISWGQQYGYARCRSVGGIAACRPACFKNEVMKPYAIYGGFGDFQNAHPELTIGWIVPPLKVFLLDRLPMSPWLELSEEYVEKGLQRAWTNYTGHDKALWDWWQK